MLADEERAAESAAAEQGLSQGGRASTNFRPVRGALKLDWTVTVEGRHN